ncbi:hypothetical protein N802_15530 [Knoellia sinensis KCTC 19936]|uniref:Uncharacterized protein n=2 Tax=Knoellia TaxID=136099 RepID=A0A0A0JAI9_9MICO|nr:hypothetical protein N802_15530 [Knoellia sinensis KCTC 19936]
MTPTRRPSRSSAAPTPARAKDDFPDAPAGARPDPGEPLHNGTGQTRPDGSILQNNPPDSGSSITDSGPATVTIDDNAVEYLQLGAGVLAGVALAGAGVAMVSRHHHRAAHPA